MDNNKNVESRIYPELNSEYNLKNKLSIYKMSEIENQSIDQGYIQIRSEMKRGSRIVESLWINKDQEDVLTYIIDEIKIKREEKKISHKIKQSKLSYSKEKKFNNIYDNNNLPLDKRKTAYKYFVLNDDIANKDIKIQNIESYIKKIDKYSQKNKVKFLKKKLKGYFANNKKIFVSDYSLIIKSNVYIKERNSVFKRDIEIFNLNNKAVSKINIQKFNLIEFIEDNIYSSLRYSIRKEIKSIKKRLNILNSFLKINNLNIDITNKALQETLNIYNYDEMKDEFLFNVFSLYSERCSIFSEKQNEIFKMRKKFRNRKIVSYNKHDFETCFYLKYKDFENDFKLFINSGESYISKTRFYDFFKTLNNNFIDRKWKTAESNIDYFITNTFNKLKSKSTINDEEAIKINIEKLLIENISRPPENRRKEINRSRLLEIYEGQEKDFINIANKDKLLSEIKLEYKNLFPEARKRQRKISFYIGKTNSGKTYKAFNDLSKYKSGIYLSPLRLLALEGQQELLNRGVPCSMITGEEKNIIEGAKFESSTIEMFNPQKEYDCVVIDEIQMIKDEGRGWAWSQALIGANTDHLILTGSIEVLDTIKELCKYTGDILETENLSRKSELKLRNKKSDINNLKDGTAIITFSRRDVLELKISLKNKNVSVIYGNLGPDVRRKEAEKFRNGTTKILIATDAIAMGLNLPIETVLFHKHKKEIRGEVFELDNQLVHQISGRAGRYGLKETGYVGALSNSSLNYIKRIMSFEIPKYKGKVYIKPDIKTLEKIQEVVGTNDFAEILNIFKNIFIADSDMFDCYDIEKQIELYEEIKDLGLTLKELLIVTSAPVRENNDNGIHLFKKYVSLTIENRYLERKKTAFYSNINKYINLGYTTNKKILNDAEDLIHEFDLYKWFNNIDNETFHDINSIEKSIEDLNSFISLSLENLKP